jgi:hypothetical protein
MAPLVAGSMSPDFPLFVGWSGGYALSHSLVGTATVDVAVALVAVWSWFAVFRGPLLDLAPTSIRVRLPLQVTLTRRGWWWSGLAAWVGALTHVLWDSFTHAGRWGNGRLTWLEVELAGLPRYEWAQYASTVLGGAVVFLVTLRHVRSLSPVREPEPLRPWVPCLVPAAFLVGSALGIVVWLGGSSRGVLSDAFGLMLDVMVAVFWCVAALCLAWRSVLRKLAVR